LRRGADGVRHQVRAHVSGRPIRSALDAMRSQIVHVTVAPRERGMEVVGRDDLFECRNARSDQ